MAGTKNPLTLRTAAFGALLAGLLGALGSSGCASEPCVGSGCPRVCVDPTCEGGGEIPAAGGTGGVTGGGRFSPCASDAACDTAHGFSCVLGECRHACSTHFDCVGVGPCEPLAGTGANYCAPLAAALPAGGYYTRCPRGEECTAAGFTCLGAGVGDVDAYCSGTCSGDTDCPSGFFCDAVRGTDNLPENRCVRRAFCAPCATDADCLGFADRICARDASGEKICTKRCDPAVVSCPWGNASECGLFDAELGVTTCSHRFGSCRGTGKTCEPCVRPADCPNGICNRSSFTEERWCVDLTVECDCEGLPADGGVCSGDNGCPRSPGGVGMLCYDNPADQQSTASRRCFAGDPVGAIGASPQLGCWNRL
jgi:hypothetical protein